MQNYLVHQPVATQLQHHMHRLKKLLTPKRRVPLKCQLPADDLINRLAVALNSDQVITIQVNVSLLSEEVTNFTGYVYQNQHGEILIQSPKTHQMTIILPGTIRHITL